MDTGRKPLTRISHHGFGRAGLKPRPSASFQKTPIRGEKGRLVSRRGLGGGGQAFQFNVQGLHPRLVKLDDNV